MRLRIALAWVFFKLELLVIKITDRLDPEYELTLYLAQEAIRKEGKGDG